MSREVYSVIERCPECGTVTLGLILSVDLDDNGDERKCITREPVPHTRRECQRTVALAREEWPHLALEF
jgi:hypothetical protein